MKNIKLLLLLVATCSLQFSWAQTSTLNNGRSTESKPAAVGEQKAETPINQDIFNGSDRDIKGQTVLDAADEKDLFFPADIEILQEELYNSAAPRQVVERLNALTTQVQALLAANEELRRENEVIRKSINNCCSASNLDATDAYLLQNSPNPTADQAQVRYFVPENMTDARVEISDLKGIVVQTYELSQKGLNSFRVNTQELEAGNYVYTLYVEGAIVDSRIMIVAK